LSAVRVDAWLDYVGAHLRPGPALPAALACLDAYLALRTYLVGDAPTIADYAAWGALQANGHWAALRKRFPHASRWHALLHATPGAAALAEEHGLAFRPANEVAKAKAAAGGLGGGATGSFDIGLPGAVPGRVVTRFPPEPSGYLHIGHAKAALLNDFFAKHYEGTLLLRFDDTNPAKESTEFTDSILADLATLGVKWDRLTYTSDYFPQLLTLAERLIAAGALYADDTPVEKMREERMAGIESARRGRSVEENLAAWREMVAGTDVGKATCMRFKMDMAATNKTLCDPVAYRCNETPHWRTGTAYKVRGMEGERKGGGGGAGWVFLHHTPRAKGGPRRQKTIASGAASLCLRTVGQTDLIWGGERVKAAIAST
jgi:glutamyl-tRNA synthetase